MPAKAKRENGKISPGMSDEAVKSKTGRTWSQWRKTLDADGCRKMDHKSIARHVHEKHGVVEWWAQTVTVGYERLAGLRERHQTADGFAASASRTIAVDLGRLYKAWSDARMRKRWLGDESITIRTATANKSMRLTWSDGATPVEINFYEKGPGKSQVTVQHRKLPSAREVTKLKAMWGQSLDALKVMLEG